MKPGPLGNYFVKPGSGGYQKLWYPSNSASHQCWVCWVGIWRVNNHQLQGYFCSHQRTTSSTYLWKKKKKKKPESTDQIFQLFHKPTESAGFMKEPSVFWAVIWLICIFENHGYLSEPSILVQFLIPTQHGYDPLAIISANLSIGLFMLSWVDELKCTNCIVKFF